MKIVTLSTYPVDNARHGGQHRVLNIAEQLRLAGHTVVSAGVLGSPHYPPSPGFVPLPPPTELNQFLANPMLMEDWALGQLFASDDKYFESLSNEIPDDVDVIHVEHPWLFKFATRHLAERATRNIRLAYGSANVEHALKRRIVTTYLGERHASECAELVMASEIEAIREADIVCAVSHEDLAWVQGFTAQKVVLAPNGASPRSYDAADLRKANEHSGHHRFAMYSASAHPPNVVGFFDMFGRGVGCFSPEERLLIAGSAGSAIQGHDAFSRTPGLRRHFRATGEVDDGCLAALLATAHALLLPITQGGGTNLKTAEALWAGKHIVATPLAMRGFEEFTNASGVAVCADAGAYRIAVREAMGSPLLVLTDEDRRSREKVLWSNTLAAYVACFEE